MGSVLGYDLKAALALYLSQIDLTETSKVYTTKEQQSRFGLASGFMLHYYPEYQN